MAEPHVLEISISKGCEECYQNFLRDPDGKNYCGPRSWNTFTCYDVNIICPGGDRESRDCGLWLECDHRQPDPEDYPCELEDDGRSCTRWDNEKQDFTGAICANCEAAEVADDDWYDTHPNGQYCPVDGCWAQWCMEDFDSSMGDIPFGFDGTWLGVHEVYVQNLGGFDDGYVGFYQKS